jgi:hypothetical protein
MEPCDQIYQRRVPILSRGPERHQRGLGPTRAPDYEGPDDGQNPAPDQFIYPKLHLRENHLRAAIDGQSWQRSL